MHCASEKNPTVTLAALNPTPVIVTVTGEEFPLIVEGKRDVIPVTARERESVCV